MKLPLKKSKIYSGPRDFATIKWLSESFFEDSLFYFALDLCKIGS